MQRPSFHGETTLRQVNARGARSRQYGKMPKHIFRCAGTGLNVQVWLPDEAPTVHADSYEAVTCPACARVHLVNKTTGKTLGDKEK